MDDVHYHVTQYHITLEDRRLKSAGQLACYTRNNLI